MKPNGLQFTLHDQGIGMRVTRPTATEDAIWDAVDSAVLEGWTVERFRSECAEAWAHAQREQAEADAESWRKR